MRIGGFEVIGFYRESQSDKKGFCCAENTVRLLYYGSSVPRKSGLLVTLVIYLAVCKEPASVKPSILETAQQLRALAVLAEDPGLAPSTYMSAHNSSSGGSNVLFRPSQALLTHMLHAHTDKNTHPYTK